MIQKIENTDTLETGFRGKYNETVDEMVSGNAAIESGTNKPYFPKNGGGKWYFDAIFSLFYTKTEIAGMLGGGGGGIGTTPSASETVEGTVEIATTEEAKEFFDNRLVITPYTLGQVLSQYFVDTDAFINRGVLDTAFDFDDLATNGAYEYDLDNWTGVNNPPPLTAFKGIVTTEAGGDWTIQTARDENNNIAVRLGVDGAWGEWKTEGVDAYKNRGVLSPPADLLEDVEFGLSRIDEDSWEGFDYPPSECIPHGNLEKKTNGPDIILTYTDDNGFTAELLKINGEWQIDDATNPGGWVYLPTIEVEQYNEEGEQLGLTGFLKGGKFMNLSQFAIKPGEKLMGLLPKNTVMSGVPVPEDGVPFASINGTYVYTVTDWEAITDGPPNLKGKGFLKLSYYNGVVRFLAYDFWGDEINFAYAAIPGTGQAMTAWRIDTDIFCTIERLENTLLLYALKDHNHDDRYYIKSEIEAIVNRYRLLDIPITMAEIAGLSQSLANKIDVGIFQNAVPGDVIVLGSDGTPVAADPSDAYITTVALVNGKEGDAYSTTISDVSFVYPRGAENKSVSPVASERWVSFAGAIMGGSGAGLTISSATTIPNDRPVVVSLDLIYTMNGQQRREQRILFIYVEPAAATITAPNAPSGLSATAVSTSQINLSWTDNATNETVQETERSTASDFTGAVKIATLGANVNSYQDKIGLSPNTLYYYRVRAANSAGNSAWSTASATTNAEPTITSGLHANYYDTVNIRSLGSAATARTDNTINYDITNDAPTGAAVTTGAYIARWSGKVKPPVSGSYQFSFATNARTRIYFGGVLAVDSFTSDALRTLTFFKTIAANEEVPILIEYLQNNDDTFARLGYQNGATDTVVPTTWLIPENVTPLAIPVLTAAGFDADTIRLSWTLTTDPDSYEVFGGLDEDDTLPILSNITALTNTGTLRTVDVNGLSTGVPIFFQIRSKKNGIYSELSDRVSATITDSAERPNSAAPVLISRSLLNTSELTVRFQDNNTGDAETYGFRFQQVNTTAWKYLNSSSGLSDNAADMDMRSYPFAGVARSLVLANDFFAAKLIRVEVIVEKDGLRSAWAGAQESSTPVANQQADVLEMPNFHVVKDPVTGLWYDSKAETDNGSFHNFYFCEDRTELLLNNDRTPKAFRDIKLPSGRYLMFRKLRLNKSVYPTYQRWMTFAYLSNMAGGNPSNVMYCAQNIVRTFDEGTTGGPIDPPPTTGRNIDYNTAYSFYINLYTMSFTAWNTVKIKQLTDASAAVGFKAIQLSFSPYKVWNNYTSPGAFNADSLTWRWDEINDIINYVCNTKGLKLIVRLHPDMSDFALDHYAANAETPTLKAAWDSYFDKDNVGEITGLKIDNLTTPPWMLFRRFCAAFKAQYANYWDSGKILVWEFATNRNQEAQIHPNTTTITMPPNFTQYTERTEWMYEMGQVMLGVMSGWEDNQWNVGSWVNEGFQIRGNSMGYSRFTTGFKGMRGNHDSNWSKDERDFHDLIMYTRTKKGTGRYYSVEYFRKDNLVEASAMAQTVKNSMNNAARLAGFVYSDDNINNTLDFINDVGTRLSGYHTRPLATPQITPVDFNFSLQDVFNIPYTTPVSVLGDQGIGGGMLGQYLFNKNTMGNIPQYMSIVSE